MQARLLIRAAWIGMMLMVGGPALAATDSAPAPPAPSGSSPAPASTPSSSKPEKASVEKGDTIIVPLVNIELRKSALDGDAKLRAETHAKLQGDAITALPFARTAWLQGDFQAVQKRLEPFAERLDYLDTAAAVEVGLLLARTYVAFDNVDLAIKLFTQVVARKKTQVLSPYTESPKVIEAWKRAGGQLRA